MRTKLIGLAVAVVVAVIAIKVVHALVVPVIAIAVVGGIGYGVYKLKSKG